jgi:hypothetical protein
LFIFFVSICLRKAGCYGDVKVVGQLDGASDR